MSWKSEVIADSSGQWTGNAVRLPSRQQAVHYSIDLAMRWTAVRQWRVVKSSDPVTDTWKDGKLTNANQALADAFNKATGTNWFRGGSR